MSPRFLKSLFVSGVKLEDKVVESWWVRATALFRKGVEEESQPQEHWDFSTTYLWCVIVLFYPKLSQRGWRAEGFYFLKKYGSVCVSVCVCACAFVPVTNTLSDSEILKYLLPFSHSSFFPLSTSEGKLHPSNSPPGSFILRLGPARIPCQRLSLLLNIKSSVSRLPLSSPRSVLCIFRSRADAI